MSRKRKLIWYSSGLSLLLFGLVTLLLGSGCGVGVTVCKKGAECEEKRRCVANRCEVPKVEGNHPPIARAGRDLRVKKGGVVRLDGATSSDVDLDRLSFEWVFRTKPTGSKARISNPRGAQTTFTADVSGTFIVKLVATDAVGAKAEDEVTVKVNHPPEADAGGNQLVMPGAVVQLKAKDSRDLDGDTMTYKWKLLKKPEGSNSFLKNPTLVQSSFQADKPGKYLVELRVSDGMDETTSSLEVKVINPGEVSPELTHITPNESPTRSIANVNVYGNNFVQGAKVKFGDKDVPTEYRSLKRVVAKLHLADTKVGKYPIKVINPGGKETNTNVFEVLPVPQPRILLLNPKSVTAGASIKVKIQGTGFVLDAKVFFNSKYVQTKYIDSQFLEATIYTGGLKTGDYPVIVENDPKKRSAPAYFKVVAPPPQPAIYRITFSPSSVPYINRKYDSVQIYARGLLPSSRVLLDDKAYTGKIKVNVAKNGGTGTITLSSFSSMGFTQGYHTFKVSNYSPGKTVESAAYRIMFGNPDIPSLRYPRFYDENGYARTPATNQSYKYVDLSGYNFHTSLEVHIDGKKYAGRVERLSKSLLRIRPFSTKGFNTGTHTFKVYNLKGGQRHASRSVNFTLQDGRIPLIRSVTTSNGSLYTERTYAFLRISAEFVTSETKVFIDGQEFKGNKHLDQIRNLYLYQFKTTNVQPGNHTLMLRNRIDGKDFNSRIYTLRVLDGKMPVLRRIRFLPSSSVYAGEIYQVQLTVENVRNDSTVLVDGKPYSASVQVSQTLITLPKFDTTGLTPGSHTMQIRNLFSGQYYTSVAHSFYVRTRPVPRLNRVTPNVISQQKPTTVNVYGYNFAPSTKLFIKNEEVKPTYRSSGLLTVTIDPKKIGAGHHPVKVTNKDGQSSNIVYLDVIPDVGPAVWRFHPNELHLSGGNQLSTVQITMYGFLLKNGSAVMHDGKVIGTIHSASTNYARANITTTHFTKSGPVSLQVRDTNGRLSNKSEIQIVRSDKPEILRTSPYVLYRRTTSQTLTIYGRGFSTKSEVYVNKTKMAASYIPQTSSPNQWSGYLRVLLSSQFLSNVPDTFPIQIKDAAGKTSRSYMMGFQTGSTTGQLVMSYVSPAVVYVPFYQTRNFTIRGSGFSGSTKLYINGKEYPVQYSNTSYLRGTFNGILPWKAGEYLHWQLKDGKYESNHSGVYVTGGIWISSVSSPVISKKTSTPILSGNVSYVPPGSTIEVFGKSFPIFVTSGNFKVNLTGELTKVKAGLQTFRIKSPAGVYGPTAGFYVVD